MLDFFPTEKEANAENNVKRNEMQTEKTTSAGKYLYYAFFPFIWLVMRFKVRAVQYDKQKAINKADMLSKQHNRNYNVIAYGRKFYVGTTKELRHSLNFNWRKYIVYQTGGGHIKI